MALEPIKLDDLAWSEMVAAIRRRIAAASGGRWTLHAPVDPGITMLELFAWLLEQRVYWMDQLPDSLVRGALSLLGEAPKPTQVAATVMRFSTPKRARALKKMERLRLERSNPPLVFSTEHEITLLPFVRLDEQRDKVGLFIDGTDRTTDLEQGKVMRLFPSGGAAAEVRIVLWLREPLPASLAGKKFSLLFDLRDTSGIAPQWSPGAPADVPPPAPVEWFYGGPGGGQVRFGDDDVDDGTGGLRRSGLVTLPIKGDWQADSSNAPKEIHQYSLWMRVGRASFTAPPRLERLIPNVVIASHRRRTGKHTLRREWLPLPGNTISLADLPEREAVKDHPPIENTVSLRVRERDSEWHEWQVTPDLNFHGPTDRVFTVDRLRGEVRFGDGLTGRLPVLAVSFKITEQTLERLRSAAVAELVLQRLETLKGEEFSGEKVFLDAIKTAVGADDAERIKPLALKHGAAPQLEVRYCVGGGAAGRLGANLGWSLEEFQNEGADDSTGEQPEIDPQAEELKAINVVRAEGGDEPETISSARERMSSALRQRTRAVTREDYEEIARTTPGVAIRRAHAAVGFHPNHPCAAVPGAVTVFIVPDAPRPDLLSEDSEEFDGMLVESAFVAAPMPDPGALDSVRARLDETRLVASEVFVLAPRYRRVAITVEVESDSADNTKLGRAIKQKLRTFFDPLTGGDEGEGWPFGEPLRPSAILREAQRALGNQGTVVQLFVDLPGESKPNLEMDGRDPFTGDCALLRRVEQGVSCGAISLGASEEAEFRRRFSKEISQGAQAGREPACADVAIGKHELVEVGQLTVNFKRATEGQGGLR
ncbi:MAG TPA: putative baseplate assembly protein [Blastocatellia bacterium]|nr:putative baseplate assembly protein [Blastocatellia bacterium]